MSEVIFYSRPWTRTRKTRGMTMMELWNDSLFRTAILINLAAVIEKADEALLPAVYKQVSVDFQASPTGLGYLTLARSLSQSLSFPFAAYFAQQYDRTAVIAAGALIWGIATSAAAFAFTYSQLAIARVVNGAGLALVIPAIQSIVADGSRAHNRGAAFGWLGFSGNIGAILGGTFAVLLAGSSYFGISGWRIAFHLTAIVSYSLAYVLYRYALDPSPILRDERTAHKKHGVISNMVQLWGGVQTVIKVKTFQVIVAQGIIGSLPWAAMAFFAMWLELIGFSQSATAVLLFSFSVFNSLGALFGGYIGDSMARWFPNSGRVICAQFSSGIAVPLSAILLRFIPPHTDNWMAYGLLLSLMGFLISWNASSTNNPIFAEIIAEDLRTNIYALDRAFELGVASFAPPLVGYLAQEVFGYKQASDGGQAADSVANSVALSKGLLWMMAAPFAVCCLVYVALYFTYPHDRDANVTSSAAARGRVVVLDDVEAMADDANALDCSLEETDDKVLKDALISRRE